MANFTGFYTEVNPEFLSSKLREFTYLLKIYRFLISGGKRKLKL